MAALNGREAASPREWNNLIAYPTTWTIQGNSNTETRNIFYQNEAPTSTLHLSSAIKPQSISEGWKAVSSVNSTWKPTLLSAFSGAWRSLARAVPYFPSKGFIKVEEGSDLLFANRRAILQGFSLSFTSDVQIFPLPKALRKKKNAACFFHSRR